MAKRFSPKSLHLLNTIAKKLNAAASSWVPEARLVGDVQAEDIALLCEAWLAVASDNAASPASEEI
jgi:hypothetical protein